MDVCQILYSGLGGHGSVAFSLLEARTSATATNHLIFYGIERLRSEYEARAAALRVDYSFVSKKKGGDWTAFTAMVGALRKAKPNIIVNHSPSAILPVYYYALRNRVPVVTVEHQANTAKTWKDRFWSRLALTVSAKVVVLTEEYGREYAQIHKWSARGDRVEVINNGIDTDRFSPASVPSANAVGQIGMASRLTPHRDHRGLIEAMSMLQDRELTLCIAGAGETEAFLKQTIHERGLEDRIKMVGLLDEDRIILFLRQLSVYVHASAFETMSTSIMQAMAVGLPIVAYDVPGVNNLIEHERTGILVPPHNAASLSRAISLLLDDQELAQRLGANARNVMEQRLSSTAMLSRYEALFESLHRNSSSSQAR
jgi:glycosyltransferase involved in cell wall biosynthesis